MANEFKIKNGLLVSGSITGVTESLSDDSGKMASTGWIRSYLSTNGYLTSVTSSAVTTALGYTPVTNARSITINGTTYDLSADRTWTISTSDSTKLPLSGGTLTGDLTMSGTNPRIYFTDTDNNPDYFISNTDGTFTVYDVTNSVGRFKIYTTGNAEFTGSVTTNSTFNITNGLTLFGNHISTQWYNGVDGVFVNYVGYNGGTTQFRNFYVYDGKQGVIATFDGSAKSFTLNGNLSVNNGANTAVSLNGSAFVGVEYSRASNIFGYVGTENTASGGMRYNSVNGNYEHNFYTNSVLSFKLSSSRQIQFNAYTSATSFTGTVAGYLAFDSSGNVITVGGISSTVSDGFTITTHGTANNTPSTPSVNIGVYNGVYAFIDLATQNTNGSWIDFSKGDGGDFAGRIRYYNTDDHFGFHTNGGGEKVTISSTGVLAVNGNTVLHAGNYSSYALPASGGTLTGNRPIQFDTGGGAIFVTGNSGGWSMGTYYKGSDGVVKGGFGAYGGGSGFNWLWIGVGYDNTWAQINSSVFNTQVALQQNGNQVLHAGNYTSYSPSLTGGGASGTWGINITGYAMSLNGYANQTEYTILNGPANGPVIKVRYDSATANRYIDFGSKDGNGVYYEGLKIYNGNTPTWGGNTILHAGNYNSYSPTLTGGGASGTWGINVTGSSRSLLFSGDSAKAFLDGLWAGGGSYPGYQFTGGNSRFGFSSTSGVVDVYADGNFYATDSSYLVLHAGNIGSYTSGNSNQLQGSTAPYLFNNMNNAHGTYTDFNSPGDFGVRYMQGSTNGPGTGASQYYGFTLGLGSQYAFGTYGSQLYWNRVATGGNPYISVRFQEGGSWSSWSKIYAGYADTAGTATNITQYVINQNLSTGADVTHAILRASSYVVTPTIYSGGGNITLGNNVANMTVAPSSASWAEGIAFTMPTTTTWGGLRWRRERGNNDGNWAIGYTALDSTDDLVFVGQDGSTQRNDILRLSKSGIVSAKYGYVSYGNPWGTSDSAFFPNGITTAGSTNWIYGTTFLGNAPGNGAGHQFWSDGIQYSTQRVSIGTNDTSRSYWDGRSSRAGLLITGVPYPAIHVDATDNNNTTHGAVISLTGGLSSGGYRRWGMGIANRDPSVFSIGWYDNQSNPHYGVGTGWSYPARLSLDTSGNLVVSGDITAYGSLSDINLKIIKEKVPNALDGLMKLSGYRFDWKEDKNRLLNIKEDIGVIAQEVEQVFPELARTGDNGNMSVRYQGLTAVLIEAVKEQQAQITAQGAQITELMEIIKTLKGL